MAKRCGARLVIDNDAHAPGDLIPRELRQKVGLGAGLSLEEIAQATANAWAIVERCRGRR
jgi:histidinol phosphatase-like PHP family hydrolase